MATEEDIAIAEAEAEAAIAIAKARQSGRPFSLPGIEGIPETQDPFRAVSPPSQTDEEESRGLKAIVDVLSPGLTDTTSAIGAVGARGALSKIIPTALKRAPIVGPLTTAATNVIAPAIGYYQGNKLGQMGEDTLRSDLSKETQDLLDFSSPGVQPPSTMESLVGGTLVSLFDKVGSELAKSGKAARDMASANFRKAGNASAKALGEIAYDKVADKFRPKIDESLNIAASTGAFDGVWTTDGLYKGIKVAREKIANALFGKNKGEAQGLISEANERVSPLDIGNALEEVLYNLKAKNTLPPSVQAQGVEGGTLPTEKLVRDYDRFLKAEVEGAIPRINSLLELQNYKHFIQKTINWENKDATVVNEWRVELQKELADQIAKLTGKALNPIDEAGAQRIAEQVAGLNRQLGALIDVDEKVFTPAVRAQVKGSRITFTKAAAITGVLMPTSAAMAFGGDPLKASIPAGLATGLWAGSSPAAKVLVGQASHIASSLLSGAAKIPRGIASKMVDVGLAPESQRGILEAIINKVGVAAIDPEIVKMIDSAFTHRDGDSLSMAFSELVKTYPETASLFETAPFGYNSYFGNRLRDLVERYAYGEKLKAADDGKNTLEITRELAALNKDGTVLNEERFNNFRVGKATKNGQEYTLVIPKQDVKTTSVSSKIAESVRQEEQY